MYNFNEVEQKWIKYWDDNKTFFTDVWDFSKPKYYTLGMFPYPSGHGLHVGHPESYTAVDIIARMKRMQGYNVLNPMGFDSYGLPAEQFAIKTGNHPAEFTNRNIATYVRQLKSIGFSYDWDKSLSTSEPEYYKWTQWIFKQMYLDGLAKIVEMPVNWCEELGSVLSNDEIVDGKSERGGYPVVKKMMKQWVVNVPAFAEQLLEGLDEIDWPESTKEMQRNWIGKSVGAKVLFEIDGTNDKLTVFTTRPDTLFGATYCVVAPEHEIVKKHVLESKSGLSNDIVVAVNEYIEKVKNKSDLERTDLNKDKTGVFTGLYAVNPANGKKLPIYISDYVLMNYGTGAIMAVPAHDQRDYEFAKAFNLDIIQVLAGGDIETEAMTGDGEHINSDFLNGLNKSDAIDKMCDWLEQNGFGSKAITYRLREWIFARQRYWGEPMPIVYLENGETYVLSDDELPLDLPVLQDYSPKPGQTSPLDKATDWVNVVINGIKGKRETSTMPSSAASSWYFMRYIDAHNDKEFASTELLNHWLPVDLYIGGSEHAVGHLIYSRFFHKYLAKKGFVNANEPFRKLIHQGIILGENGVKMSKSLGNVVNPDEIISEFGADSFRVYEMFMGPLEAMKPWQSGGIVGSKKFIDRIHRLYFDENKISELENKNLSKIYNETVKKVTQDYETLNFNTAISQMMIFLNAVAKEEVFPKEYAMGFVKLLSPVAPFIAEEIWQNVFGFDKTITYENWPVYDEKALVEDESEIVVQVNGKVKTVLKVQKNSEQDDVVKLAVSNEVIANTLENKEIVKTIFVANKLLNFVVR